jgi:hypothetical protein
MSPDNEPVLPDNNDEQPEDTGLLTPYAAGMQALSGTGLAASVARLRLLLGTVDRRTTEAKKYAAALRQQLRRVPTRAVNGHMAVDAYLVVMHDTRARLSRAEAELEDLDLLRKRIQQEIGALELMNRLQRTQQELAELRDQARWDPREEVLNEVKRLEALAQEFVAQAGRSVASSGENPPLLQPPS